MLLTIFVRGDGDCPVGVDAGYPELVGDDAGTRIRVEEEALHIFTHGDLRPVVAHRFEQVLTALDHADDPIA